MVGLMKKDFLLIKANIKSMIIIFIVFFIFAFQGTFDIAFIVPIIGIMLFISTFSYDDFNNWNSYAVTLPDGRKNVVRAKYVASIILAVALGTLCLSISMAISYVRTNNINFDDTLSLLMGTILSSLIIISLIYTIMLKYGAKNGRIIMFVMIFGIAGIGVMLEKFIDMTFLINMINELDNYMFIAVPVISIILLGISYLISSKIYINKEF